MEIIPVINCAEFECVADRAKKAEAFAKWVHLDVADARFTFGKSWGDPQKWKELNTSLNLEVHLMVEEPEQVAEAWLDAGAKRLIVHLETVNNDSFQKIRKLCEARGAELMLAVNPETPAERLRPFFGEISRFQILAVHPGPAGQNFLPLSVDKIKFLRRELPNAIIETDGGINLETAKLVKDAGADSATSASYIFGAADPQAAYEELCEV